MLSDEEVCNGATCRSQLQRLLNSFDALLGALSSDYNSLTCTMIFCVFCVRTHGNSVVMLFFSACLQYTTASTNCAASETFIRASPLDSSDSNRFEATNQPSSSSVRCDDTRGIARTDSKKPAIKSEAGDLCGNEIRRVEANNQQSRGR